MNFLALFLGLVLERLFTNLFHLREFHWLDPVIDFSFRGLKSFSRHAGMLGALLVVAVLVAPVALVELSLQDQLGQVPLFVFAVVVLLFCLGPRDLGEEVNDYRDAITNDDQQEVAELSMELLECTSGTPPEIDAAIYAQANNRVFAVVFWFALLGPAAAWLFRVLDLMRRRVVQQACSAGPEMAESALSPVMHAATTLHRLAAWIPARLLMIAYALAGSFDGASSAWREPHEATAEAYPGPDDQLLARVGRAAAGHNDDVDVSTRASLALNFVLRTLWTIWCPALALLTLYGWLN